MPARSSSAPNVPRATARRTISFTSCRNWRLSHLNADPYWTCSAQRGSNVSTVDGEYGARCLVGKREIDEVPQELSSVLDGAAAKLGKAEEVGAKLYLYGRDWFFEETPLGFRLIHGDRIEDYPFPNLTGRHQIENAATSIMALRDA